MTRDLLEYDQRTVVAVKPLFNKVHDNMHLLSQRIRAVWSMYLPMSLWSTHFILAATGVKKIGHHFLKNGL